MHLTQNLIKTLSCLPWCDGQQVLSSEIYNWSIQTTQIVKYCTTVVRKMYMCARSQRGLSYALKQSYTTMTSCLILTVIATVNTFPIIKTLIVSLCYYP